MSISLNITTGSKPKASGANKQQAKKSAPPQPKKKKGAAETNDFAFNFTSQAPVKAVVAKRRNPAVLAKKKQAQNETATQSAAPSKPVKFAKPSAAATPAAAATVAPVASSAATEDNISLSLNVTQGSEQDHVRTLARLEKRKLNSKQRKEKVLEKRAQTFQAQEAQAIDTTKTTSGGIVEFGDAAAGGSKPKPRPVTTAPIRSENQQNYAKNKLALQNRPKKMSSLFANNPTVPVIGQRLVNPLNETVFTGASMASIGLHDHAVKNLADILQITELTTVQQRTVPVVLSGRDVLVRSQTGSGKTLAYALPIVQRLQAIRPKLSRDGGIQALVIVPTRELAIQVYELFIKLLKPFTWIVSGYLTGGEKRKAEKARLRKGLNILVGTPGRLVDHLLHTESFRLDQVRMLVLDEADRLFDMGYEKDVQKIIDVLNAGGVVTAAPDSKNPFAKRDPNTIVSQPKPAAVASAEGGADAQPTKLQSMLLSATLTAAVRELAGLALKDPLFIDTTDVNAADIERTNTFSSAIDDAVADEKISLPSTVQQSYVLVPPKLRLVTLAGLVALEAQRAQKAGGSGVTKMLVFMGSEHLVDFHYDVMNEALTKKVLDSDDEGVESGGDDDDDDGGVKLGGGKKRNKGKKSAKRLDEYESDGDDGEEPYLRGVRFFKLHGSLTQNERSAVFKAFKEAKSGVLLTTDVAGRGIDVPHVDLVVQFSPPQKIADYVHRVGRTARAGRSGRALLFLSPNETDFVRILEDKKIRIAQDDATKLLKGIVRPQSAGATLEENASELQRKFEAVVADDPEMHDRACKAFVSWLRHIAAFPKDLRAIFNIKQAHMGHYAKSLGLREPPKSFAGRHSAPKAAPSTNRLTYTERTEQRNRPDEKAKREALKRPHHGGNLNFNKFIKKSISLQTSEFGSGMPAPKKKK